MKEISQKNLSQNSKARPEQSGWVFLLFLLIFDFFILCPFSFSQQTKVDSLLNILKTAKEDTNKVNTLNILGWELHLNKPDTSIILSNQALQMSEKQKWEKGIAKSSVYLGVYNRLQGNYKQSLQHYSKALEINKKMKDKKGISVSMGNIGNVYKDQSNYPQALDYYFKAMKLSE